MFAVFLIATVEGRITFASCSRQTLLPHKIWETISAQETDDFLWLGDSVYVNDLKISTLSEAYEKIKNDRDYLNLRKKVRITGVYDDHDYGCNDAGRGLYSPERRNLFFDFLDLPPKIHDRERPGAYYALDSLDNTSRIIYLDTRSFRDEYVIPFVQWNGWTSTVLNTAARLTAGFFGLYRFGTRDILGEEQWTWLENELKENSKKVTLLVSSIQVFTSIPLFESWQHFPKSLARLKKLLLDTRPSGLLLLSGDVHFAEIEKHGFQVTTSGLTHTCSSVRFLGFTCEYILALFPSHRIGSPFTKFNFANFEVDLKNQNFVVDILDKDGNKRLELRRSFDDEANLKFYNDLAEYESGFSSVPLVVLVFCLLATQLVRRRN